MESLLLINGLKSITFIANIDKTKILAKVLTKSYFMITTPTNMLSSKQWMKTVLLSIIHESKRLDASLLL